MGGRGFVMSTCVRASLAGFATLLLASSAAIPSAHANTYYFTQGAADLGGNLAPPGYGSLDVTTVGADLRFLVELAPSWSVDTGAHHAFTFSLATGGLALS